MTTKKKPAPTKAAKKSTKKPPYVRIGVRRAAWELLDLTEVSPELFSLKDKAVKDRLAAWKNLDQLYQDSIIALFDSLYVLLKGAGVR